MATTYRIHPAIGIARVGDSPDGYFIGPEFPGHELDMTDPEFSRPPNGLYKDDGKIKRQGARFRIYQYEEVDGKEVAVREITHRIADIEWKVKLVNRKAAGSKIFRERGNRNPLTNPTRLIIDSGHKTIQGILAGKIRLEGAFQGGSDRPHPVPLGDLITDGQGRLIVLGGFGKSFSPEEDNPLTDTFNNVGWCDDTSDGSVNATIRLDGGKELEVEPAWVIVGPPDFAPPIGNVVSLYDIVYEASFKNWGEHHDPLLEKGKISFTRHIMPLLHRAADFYWVDANSSNSPYGGHGPGDRGDFRNQGFLRTLNDKDTDTSSEAFKFRFRVLKELRSPDGNGGCMPFVQAEGRPIRLPRVTEPVYEIMECWAQGKFESDFDPDAAPPKFSDLPFEDQPFALDKAALDACVGASLYPGIEAPRILRHPTDIYEAPFRIKRDTGPGTITQGLALPWQSDFYACSEGWWPAQRPNNVFLPGGTPTGRRVEWAVDIEDRNQFLDHWAELGFIVENPDFDPADRDSIRYFERERNISRSSS